MFIGSYIGSLNEKRRIAIPKKFLNELGNKPILAKWYEDCLVLVSVDYWEKLFNRLTGGTNNLNFGVRDLERFLLGSAFETEPDEQGRIVIPEILVRYAKITKEVVFIGLYDRVEIWPMDVWEKKSEKLSLTTKEFIENISKK